MLDPRVKIIDQLRPTAEKLVRRVLKRYENSIYAYCFNPSELTAVSEDLMLVVAERRIQNLVDEKGIYNYFAECFNHKCQDIYHAHAKTKKRGSVEIDPKDLSECKLNDGSTADCPEMILSLKQEIDSVVNFLKKHDKPKAPFSKIIYLFLSGKNSAEIQQELGITASSLDRYKQQAIELIKANLSSIEYEYLPPDSEPLLFVSPKTDQLTVKSHMSREIKFVPKKDFVAKFSYYCTIEMYKENKLLRKDRILLKQEDSDNKEIFFTLEKTNLRDIELEFKNLIETKTNELKAA